MRVWERAGVWSEFVKFEHTIFALPFAYLGYVLGVIAAGDGRLYLAKLGWITLVMVGARTFGMSLNRIVDRKIDAQNPRTATRPLVTGRVSVPEAYGLAVISLAAFVYGAFQFGPLCRILFFPALGIVVLYHYMKRFTALCHYGIGLVLACAPAGGWVVAAGYWDWRLMPLAGAVLVWTAGFDLLYSLQDVGFDKRHGLHSVPARYGRSSAFLQSRVCHAVTVGLLLFLGIILPLGVGYFGIVTASALLLVLEHILVARDERKYLSVAFFTLNGIFSAVFCTAVIAWVMGKGMVGF